VVTRSPDTGHQAYDGIEADAVVGPRYHEGAFEQLFHRLQPQPDGSGVTSDRKLVGHALELLAGVGHGYS
jgi:hypothetical protein